MVKIDRVFYPKQGAKSGDWSSFLCDIQDVYEGEPHTNNGKLSVKGIVPTLNYYDLYSLIAQYSFSETYGHQYEVIKMNKQVNFDNLIEQRQFLETILTEHQVNLLYESVANPFELVKNKDIESLVEIKGIGEYTAKRLIQAYCNNIDNGVAYVQLANLGLTKRMLDKLIDTYGGAEILVDKIKDNPYVLIDEVEGIGWKKADEMALNSGVEPDSPNRVKGYISYYLKSSAYEGDTWATPQEIVQSIYSELGVEDNDLIRNCLYEMQEQDTIRWSPDKTKISLCVYYELESNIAQELKRLQSAENNFVYGDIGLQIKQIEQQQGWDFTNEQLQAIKMVLKNSVSIVTGYGGTGKSSVVSGVLKILGEYSFAQTALSGRAASRLSEITNEEGYTIHRLLAYNPTHGFTFNKDNPLDYDIIILDEVSMVGADLFHRLIQAIASGSKLIMIGDDGQLESIGLCNIFKDMLDSGCIPVAKLTQIHRQAAKSAIITESIKVRNHQQLTPYKWVGSETRGELQDLELCVFNNDILTQKRIVEKYEEVFDKCSDPTKIQVVVPMKYRGDISTLALNTILQDIVNPKGSHEITINIEKGLSYKLRENDKVIANRNNYKIEKEDGSLCPIFNGNKGIITCIDSDRGLMIVDFEQWGKVIIKQASWNSIELGYALTCHKLQGSESDYVIVGLDYSGRVLLTKEWLYTAITRAKKKCVLCAETNALSYCISNSNVPFKRTFLKEMLQEQN